MTSYRTAAFLAAAILLPAACTQPDPAAKDIAACTAMLTGDADIEADLSEYGSSVEGYCDCYAATLADKGETTQATVRKVVSTIVGLREDRGLGLEEAAGLIEEEVEGRTEEKTVDISMAEFEIAGELVDGVRRDLRDNEGQCSVVAGEAG